MAKHKPHTIPDNERIITPKELCERIPLDRSTIWRMVQSGHFPAPIHLGTSRIGWRLSVVLQWIADREANPAAARTYFARNQRERTGNERWQKVVKGGA